MVFLVRCPPDFQAFRILELDGETVRGTRLVNLLRSELMLMGRAMSDTLEASLEERKAVLRREALVRRKKLSGGSIGDRLVWYFHHGIVPRVDFSVTIFSAYDPIREEADCMPLVCDLIGRGARCCLPIVVGSRSALQFRAWRPGEPLQQHRLGGRVPGAHADILIPQLLLVPLLAFDRQGGRLGYGGGFYDRTASALVKNQPILMVGLAYAEQEVDAVPRGPTDYRLDWVITQDGALGPLQSCRIQ